MVCRVSNVYNRLSDLPAPFPHRGVFSTQLRVFLSSLLSLIYFKFANLCVWGFSFFFFFLGSSAKSRRFDSAACSEVWFRRLGLKPKLFWLIYSFWVCYALCYFFFSYLKLYRVFFFFFSLKLNLCQVFLCITTSLVNGIKCLNIYN